MDKVSTLVSKLQKKINSTEKSKDSNFQLAFLDTRFRTNFVKLFGYILSVCSQDKILLKSVMPFPAVMH